jgi:hypothetical protein
MKCRMCDKLEPRGCGKTCCAVDSVVVRDFDAECKFTEEEIEKYEEKIQNVKKR